jgi:hypothetical protein
MSRRAARIAFGLVFVLLGSAIVYLVLLAPAPRQPPLWLGVLCEVVVLVVGGAIAVTSPPADYEPPTSIAVVDPPAPANVSVYRGAHAPASAASTPMAKTSAQRLTIGILAGLAFTACAVPFALHLPRWMEAELVVGGWWTIWSVVLAVIAYRGGTVADDHRPGSGRVVALGGDTPKWASLLEATPDAEGCLVGIVVFAIVGIALFGAWLVVELVAPAVFVIAYRGVVRALAKTRESRTRGNVLRSALVGAGWSTAYTAPLALVVAFVHVLLRAS